MKKILSTLVLISLLVVPAVSLAVAEEGPNTIPDPGITTVGGLRDLLQTISNWIFTGLLILAGIFLVIAGYFFVTASGEAAKIKTARQMVINALIGVAIGLSAKGLIEIIGDLVGTPVP